VATCTFDENGNPDICVEQDSEFVVPADTVIFAVGQRPQLAEDFGLELGRGDRVVVDEESGVETGRPGVFAAGDAVSGTLSVVSAIAAGRRAASAIDSYLGGDGVIEEQLAPETASARCIGREEGYSGRRRSVDAPVEAERCLQCDLRMQISPPRFWGEYKSVKRPATEK
jgi:formate dehydrogenase (NADP+) beta subunit